MQVVNGYVCQNCTDVDNAKKYIDPAQPNQSLAKAQNDSSTKSNQTEQAVTFGGSLFALNDAGQGSSGQSAAPPRKASGSKVDISA